MSAADAIPIAVTFPGLQSLQQQRSAEAAAPPDAALVHLCLRLRDDLQAQRRLGTVEPEDWEGFNRDSVIRSELIHRIADTPATGRVALRAKALALHALLDEGAGDLHEDAATPDRLAWSLIEDILTE
jgi:hypothetical protein